MNAPRPFSTSYDRKTRKVDSKEAPGTPAEVSKQVAPVAQSNALPADLNASINNVNPKTYFQGAKERFGNIAENTGAAYVARGAKAVSDATGVTTAASAVGTGAMMAAQGAKSAAQGAKSAADYTGATDAAKAVGTSLRDAANATPEALRNAAAASKEAVGTALYNTPGAVAKGATWLYNQQDTAKAFKSTDNLMDRLLQQQNIRRNIVIAATREVEASKNFLAAAVKEYQNYKDSPDYVDGSPEDLAFEKKVADLTETVMGKQALLESQRLANPNVTAASNKRLVGGRRRPKHPTLCFRRAPSRRRRKAPAGNTRQGRRRFSVGE